MARIEHPGGATTIMKFGPRITASCIHRVHVKNIYSRANKTKQVHSFNTYLLSMYYLLVTFLNAEEAVLSKEIKFLFSA